MTTADIEDDAKTVTTEEGKPQPLMSAVIGGGIVALIGGLFPLLISVFSEDVQRCKVATDFLINFQKRETFSEDEVEEIKMTYLNVAKLNCVGE
ncbi:MAG: hypothetical protein AAF701_01180 [Pseudomonadota bacterium]